MAYTYPPAQPTLSGDVLTINRFLKDPTLVARRLRTLAEQRFIADVLLSQRLTTESGSVLYETGETIYADRAPEAIAPGAAYPLTSLSGGTAQLAKTVKWGRDAEITDEAISRQRMSPVERGLNKLVNSMVQTVDGVALSAIASAVSQSTAAIAPWDGSGATPNIWRDIMRAIAKIRKLNEGFDADTVVVDDIAWGEAMSDDKIATLLSREGKDSPIYTGELPKIGIVRFLPTPNLPVASAAFVCDTAALGGMADEKLAGPGYTGATAGVEVKSIRDDDNDKWRIRSRRVTVPIVLEPKAAWKITGVTA